MPKKKSPQKPKVTRAHLFWLVLVLAAILGVICAIKAYKNTPPKHLSAIATPAPDFDFNNQAITLDGKTLQFISGQASDSTLTASITNKSINPSQTNAAAILIENPGGSGIFYYIVGAIKKNNKEIYSQPILIGDRIKITSVTVKDPESYDNGEIIIEYLDRPANTPMSENPSVKTTAKYSFKDDGNLIKVLH